VATSTGSNAHARLSETQSRSASSRILRPCVQLASTSTAGSGPDWSRLQHRRVYRHWSDQPGLQSPSAGGGHDTETETTGGGGELTQLEFAAGPATPGSARGSAVLLDGGAKGHYHNRRYAAFRALRRPIRIGTAGPQAVKGVARGDITTDDSRIDSIGATYAPEMSRSLASIGKFCDDTEFEYLHTRDGVYAVQRGSIDSKQLRQVGVRSASTNYLYYAIPSEFAFGGPLPANWHERLRGRRPA